MIDISDEANLLMTDQSFIMVSRVSSWYNGQLLDGDIPISSGTEEVDVTLNVPESLRITVPRLYQGVSYSPGNTIDHPLARNGQRLHVEVGIRLRQDFELWGRGWYYITDCDINGDQVQVTAAGLLGLVDEAKFAAPYGPAGNFSTVLRSLVEPALTVDLSNAPADVAMPDGIVWDDDRLGAMYSLLDAWGATAYINEDGILVVVPAGDTDDSSFDITDALASPLEAGSTVITWGSEQTRDGAANVVVVRGYDATGADVQATAYNRDATSPTYYGGPFNALAVPYVWTTPLVTTQSQAQASANTILARQIAHAARNARVDAVPYLALQARDGVTVTSTELDLAEAFGIVDYLQMPLTPDDGAMTVGVRIP